MIAYLEGKIIKINEDSLVVLTNAGIGFKVFVPQGIFREVNKVGQEIYLNTYMQVREDGFSLFGFLEDSELDMFKKLLNVSGVGPKMALSVMSTLSVPDLILAIIGSDTKTISTAQGVGKKLADKIILELKDKVSTADYDESTGFGDMFSGSGSKGTNVSDDLPMEAAKALQSLGYSMSEALKAVRSCTIDENTSVEDLIKQALRKI